MRDRTVKYGRTAIAAATLLALSLPAQAQQAPAAAASKETTKQLDTVVVTGIRASLQKALDAKRNADSIVDAITAEDIGKLPSTNVAEAITTIPGVTIDKAFGQGEKVSILGTDPALNRTFLNGQTVASADWFITDQPGRTFNYSLLAPQLVSKVEVYKSPEAWLDEGSIGGSVNIVTRKPLEMSKPLTLAGSVSYLHNSRIGKGKPTLSGVVGWRNESKTLGVILSAQRSEEQVRRDGIESYGTVTGKNYIDGNGGGGSINNLPTDWSVPANPDGSQPKKPASCVGSCATTLLANPSAVGPNSISAHYFEQTRERDTLSLSLQARATDKLDFEFNALDVKAGYDNRSHSMFAFQGNAWNGLMKMTDLAVDGGVITKGTFKNALMVYDLIDRKATVDTNAYDFKANFKDDRWFASFHAGNSKATGGTKLQVFGEFLNWTDYNYDISSGTPRLAITGANPLKDPSAFQIDGGWGADPTKPTWNPGWGGNIVFKPTEDKEQFAQVDGGLKFNDSAVHQLRFGIKQRKHNTSQTMGGVSLASVKGYGDAKASQFSPNPLPSNYLSGFGNVGDLSNRFTIDGEALAGYITSGKWLAPWQKMPVPSTFGDPSFAANTWKVAENVNAAYVQADFALDRLRGNVGLRQVQTESTSSSFACTVNKAPCPADKYAPVSVTKKYNNTLPNLNVVYDLNDKVVLRGSAAQVMSRPNYGDMSSYLWIGDQTLTGGGGNPDLKPYKSTNLDFSAEWYFAKNSIVAGTLFHKKVDDYILVTTRKETHFNQNQNKPTEYDISRPSNAGSATIKGFALAYQTQFGYGLGLLTNYTHADAKASNGSRLPFNSKHQLTVSPFFENDTWSARATYSYRSKYYTQADRGNFLVTDDYASVDANLTYKISDQLSVSLDGMNLLDSEYRSYAEVPGVANTEKLTRGIYKTGRRYMATLRFNY
ncbi:TonB-dependent receptor [Roseateles sp.]|uniref:TonB-dependent receptor n=1 Tax=Roseateles sp. TaxID=1971397 RepID=UPI003BA45742